MTELAPSEEELPLRGERPSNPFLWVGNEFFDLYLPIIGPDCFAVYVYFARTHHSNPALKHDVRSIASSCGLKPSTVSRALEVLNRLRLVKLIRFRGSRQSECQLPDVWTIAQRQGAKFDSRTQSYRFPETVFGELTGAVSAIRARQQGKTRRKPANTAVGSCGNLSKSVSQKNTNVPPEKRQRPTRETQTGTYQLWKDERVERILSPTPSQDDELWKSKSHANEDGTPRDLLMCARIQFTGVIKDMKDHFFQPRPPLSQLKDGFKEWQDCGLGDWAVTDATRCAKTLDLVLSVPDVAKAKECLDKHHRKWNEFLARWFGCVVRLEFAGTEDGR